MLSIAIDGPAGAGKSQITTKLAKKLGWGYLNTGALYRAATIQLIKAGVNLSNAKEVAEYANKIKITVEYINGVQHTFANGKDVTSELRTAEISEKSALVSPIPEVREVIKKVQCEIATNMNVIMEGRDIGTEILPNTPNKFYLDATVEERARRRALQIMHETNCEITENQHKEITEQIKRRDFLDKTREISPLKLSDDAIYIDTSKMNVSQVLNKIISYLTLDPTKPNLKRAKYFANKSNCHNELLK